MSISNISLNLGPMGKKNVLVKIESKNNGVVELSCNLWAGKIQTLRPSIDVFNKIDRFLEFCDTYQYLLHLSNNVVLFDLPAEPSIDIDSLKDKFKNMKLPLFVKKVSFDIDEAKSLMIKLKNALEDSKND